MLSALVHGLHHKTMATSARAETPYIRASAGGSPGLRSRQLQHDLLLGL